MPQQLHLAISAQFHTHVRTCRGMKQTQLLNTEQTTYNSHTSHNPYHQCLAINSFNCLNLDLIP